MSSAEQRLGAEAFLAAARDSVVLDVRSPSEFEKGHLPGAQSFPLFTDDERAVVGTTYKQVGKSEAIDEGLKFVGPKLRRRGHANFLSPKRAPNPCSSTVGVAACALEASVGCSARPKSPP